MIDQRNELGQLSVPSTINRLISKIFCHSIYFLPRNLIFLGSLCLQIYLQSGVVNYEPNATIIELLVLFHNDGVLSWVGYSNSCGPKRPYLACLYFAHYCVLTQCFLVLMIIFRYTYNVFCWSKNSLPGSILAFLICTLRRDLEGVT